MLKTKQKRSVDMQIIRDWIEQGARVLDLGCGRGALLAFLKQTRDIEAVGVDMSPEKIRACVGRGLSAYHGDMMDFMGAFPDRHFDRVLVSRTLHEVDRPTEIISEALRVGQRVTVGFVNFGYWRNRLSLLSDGSRAVNEVFPTKWEDSRLSNHVTVKQFESFCAVNGFSISQHVYLGGDWKREVQWLPNLRCGYAIYELGRG